MTRSIVFELSAETLQACLVAREGGAHRIELCSALGLDGLTPSHALIRAAVEHSKLPIHVMLRPRPGGFLYTEEEFALMQEDLLHARSLGASGFVFGILRDDRTVDIERTQELVALASPLEVTFHRAFDLTPSLDQALEDVIAAGCHRILTSGGEHDVIAGTANIARLVRLSQGRIAVAAAGGLRSGNAAMLVRATGASHFHASLRRSAPCGIAQGRGEILSSSTESHGHVDVADVHALLQALKEA